MGFGYTENRRIVLRFARLNDISLEPFSYTFLEHRHVLPGQSVLLSIDRLIVLEFNIVRNNICEPKIVFISAHDLLVFSDQVFELQAPVGWNILRNGVFYVVFI